MEETCNALDMAILRDALAQCRPIPTVGKAFDEFLGTALLLQDKLHYIESAIMCLDNYPAMGIPEDINSNCMTHQKQRDDLCRRRDEAEDAITEHMKEYPISESPICLALSACLEKHNIVRQAFHSNSFIGNHCHKYLTPDVIESVTKAVRQAALEYTSNVIIISNALGLSECTKAVFLQYSKVHELISHKRPIAGSDCATIQHETEEYVGMFQRKLRHAHPKTTSAGVSLYWMD